MLKCRALNKIARAVELTPREVNIYRIMGIDNSDRATQSASRSTDEGRRRLAAEAVSNAVR